MNCPLKKLIEEREFDKYQPEIEYKFAAKWLKYALVYGNRTNKSAMYLNFESPTQLGRITVWISGECEVEVLDIETEKTVFHEYYLFKSEAEFLQVIPNLVLFMCKSSL